MAARTAVIVIPSGEEGLVGGRGARGAETARGLEGGEQGGLAEAGDPGRLAGRLAASLRLSQGGTRETTFRERGGGFGRKDAGG